MSNLEEFRRGRAPGLSGFGNARYLYVDNARGSDASSGALSYPAGAGGPKASIKAAMATARSGDVIVVLPGRGTYEEGSRSAHGKALTIKTVGKVTIK